MYYSDKDKFRDFDSERDDSMYEEFYRSPWSRDMARLIHSRAFRNLQGKTQLLPGQESDTYRNRLTHSYEVAQLAKSMAHKLNYDMQETGQSYRIEPEICEFASLAHDVGRPPFGHLGEIALNLKMKDSGGFEGNAQTLRILTRIAKKHYIPSTVLDTGITKDGDDLRVGLNITYRGLAAVLKYDNKIPEKSQFDSDDNVTLIKGYYETEESIVRRIKYHVSGNETIRNFSTIENQILHIADDIAYATYDLDDAFKLGIVKPIDLISISPYMLGFVVEKINRNMGSNYTAAEICDVYISIFKDLFLPGIDTGNIELSADEKTDVFITSLRMAVDSSNKLAMNGYYRVNFISKLIGRFIKSVKILEINETVPALSKITIDRTVLLEIEALKNFMYQFQVLSGDVKIVKHRGVEIISTIFDNLYKGNGPDLLPTDVHIIFDHSKNEMQRKRTICDYIAGLTDNQALNLYARLKSGNPQVVFKPL